MAARGLDGCGSLTGLPLLAMAPSNRGQDARLGPPGRGPRTTLDWSATQDAITKLSLRFYR